MSNEDILRITCKCGLTWKIPFGKGKGLFAYSFQCDGAEGCKRIMDVNVKDNQILSISGANKWQLERKV